MTRRKAAIVKNPGESSRVARRTSPRWALALWWLTLVAGIGVLIAALPAYALYFQGVSVLIPDIPSSPFATLSGAASFFTCLLCLVLAVVLHRRKRYEPMALFVSFYLIGYGIVIAGPVEFLEVVLPGAADFSVRFAQPLLFGVPTVALLVFFPDGRAVPRWTRWLIPLVAIVMVLLPWTISGSGVFRQPSWTEGVIWLLLIASIAGGIYGQVHRYRRVSTPSERQQTKWVLAGFVGWFSLLALTAIPYGYLGSLAPGAPIPSWAAGNAALWFLGLSLVPLSLAIAILRYRLYEIDIIINRALVYGGLTAILAGLYSASISLFQKLFIAVTGEQSDAAIVLTTLVLAAAFTPLRTRLQAAVDRRFKDVHDPARRLDALRDEITRGIWILHPQRAAVHVLTESVEAFDAAGGAAYWRHGRHEVELAHIRDWKEPGAVVAELSGPDGVIGRIALGPRRDHSHYSAEDRRALDEVAAAIAQGYQSSRLTAGSKSRRGAGQARRPAGRRRPQGRGSQRP